MTLVEFLHPLRGKTLRDICLGVLYYEYRYNQNESLTVEEIRQRLRRSRMAGAAKANIADVLAKSAPYVDAAGKKENRILWSITQTGQEHIRSFHGLPEKDIEVEHDVSSLEKISLTISDTFTADYIQETIKCLSVDALRASVVFLWVGAVNEIRKRVFAHDVDTVNSTLRKYDPKSRNIKQLDDLAYVKESVLLLAAQELGIFDKNERGVLEEALELRNKCGHPGNYKPGPKKVSSFIEDIVGIVFT